MSCEDVINRAKFNIGHNTILENRNSWSILNKEKGYCVSSIWTHMLQKYQGRIVYKVPSSQRKHLENIRYAIKNDYPIFGALKRKKTKTDACQKISSTNYFLCFHISLDDKLYLVLQEISGNIESKITGVNLGLQVLYGSKEIIETKTYNEQSLELRYLPYKHGHLQNRLYKFLEQTALNPGEEISMEVGLRDPDGRFKFIDLVIKEGNSIKRIYEIKTGESAQGCIRAALGQLLEYWFLTKKQASVLIIVGDCEETEGSRQYLKEINSLKGDHAGPRFEYCKI